MTTPTTPERTYPLCGRHFIPVAKHASGFSYVPTRQLQLALEAQGKAFEDEFHTTFGIFRSRGIEGPLAWDVECTLERMAVRRLPVSALF